jgi:hypothetical protein
LKDNFTSQRSNFTNQGAIIKPLSPRIDTHADQLAHFFPAGGFMATFLIGRFVGSGSGCGHGN